jgi:putative endonuclease
MHERTARGRRGEEIVAAYLEERGFSILARNYLERQGEIDLIARKGTILAFVEVKLRMHDYFDLGQVITHSKQRKMGIAAKIYLVRHRYEDIICRFDVAFVHPHDQENPVTYIEDAFQVM